MHEKRKIYKRTNNGTQLTCIDKTSKYKPTKYSIPVQVCASSRGDIYTEVGAELEINEVLPAGPIDSFDQLLASQATWIRDLVDFQ